MLNKIIYMLFSFGFLTSSLSAYLPDPLPETFTVKECWLSWTTDFNIETKEYKLGHVHRKLLSLKLEYQFYDIYSQLEATAKSRWFSWGVTFDVYDNRNNLLGTVEEKVFSFFPTFTINALNGEKLATAKLNFWGTRYTLKDPVTNSTMVTMERPFFRMKDNWKVTIRDQALFYQKGIDPRLFIIVMAFQTDKDNWESSNNNYKASASTEVSVIKDLKIFLNEYDQLSEQLEIRRDRLAAVEPSELDFDKVEKLSEERLKALESDVENINAMEGLHYLLSMLDDDELNDAEKNALYQLMEYKLSTINSKTNLIQ